MVVARRESPDLITLDITMPGKDGKQVFEAMRKDPDLKSIPVCIITGQPELRKLIYDRSVPPPNGYVDKPISEETLMRNVRKILEIKQKVKK
ncbi:MAG: response regulator [candidate division Zixibacteria bacterium]|nr:response regulator [candidate division Zixibacteria bacterium]NIR62653.1 response regulator [candidate division Zixibacteria bacterium]NIS15511.1 response regulator [candidate division Zixibacteria bacterium]NIS44738.1 response regulator [candidate division Zixibacteria bacterium]NIT52030.1 response regulator [candidate division Zixibacteria bacterium]